MLQLMGAAGSLISRRRGMVGRGDKTPMVSVTNVDPDRIAELLEDFWTDVRTVLPPVLSIRNGRRSVVITGTPEQLGRFELYCSKITEKEEAERKNKLRGGAVFSPEFHGIQVEVGFHTPRLAGAVDLVDELGGADRPRRRARTRLRRGRVRRASRLGGRGRAAARLRREVDRRPRPHRHRDTADRARDPGPRRRHDPRRHPRRSAQSVHRGRRARGAARRGRVRAHHREAARRLGEAVDQVHPADRAVADPARRHDADDRRRQDRRRCGQRRLLGRAGRRRPGHRGDLRRPHRRARRAARAGPAVQFNSLFLDPYLWKLQVGGKRWCRGPGSGRADRRRRRHPRASPISRTPSS